MAEAYRILKSGGKVLVIDWTDSYGGMGPPVSDIVSSDNARYICEEAGFIFEKEFSAGTHHFGFIVKKS